jgi:hypothetical protein
VGTRVSIYGCPTARADYDRDGDVDQEDYGYLQRCLSGAGIAPEPGCAEADLERDNDVDVSDLLAFIQCLSGPAGAANPNCSI